MGAGGGGGAIGGNATYARGGAGGGAGGYILLKNGVYACGNGGDGGHGAYKGDSNSEDYPYSSTTGGTGAHGGGSGGSGDEYEDGYASRGTVTATATSPAYYGGRGGQGSSISNATYYAPTDGEYLNNGGTDIALPTTKGSGCVYIYWKSNTELATII